MKKRVCNTDVCRSCDLGHIIANYVTPLMQCLTNDIHEFNMQLITTKCLNTAVMLMFFLLGKKGMRRAHHCDSTKVYDRLQRGQTDNKHVVKKMEKNVLSKQVTHRYIYYILMNDGYFQHPDGKQRYFPGHVFILEKIPATPDTEVSFNVYQSYINQYDLKGYLGRVNNTFHYSFEETKQLLKKIEYIVTNDVWDEKCVQYWKDFTHVDTTSMLGASQKGTLSICYTYDKVSNCLHNIERYAIRKLDQITAKRNVDHSKVYGDMSLYTSSAKPLSIGEMKKTLVHMIYDIASKKKNV